MLQSSIKIMLWLLTAELSTLQLWPDLRPLLWVPKLRKRTKFLDGNQLKFSELLIHKRYFCKLLSGSLAISYKGLELVDLLSDSVTLMPEISEKLNTFESEAYLHYMKSEQYTMALLKVLRKLKKWQPAVQTYSQSFLLI